MITILVVRDPDSGDDIQVWDGDDEITYDRDKVDIVVVDAGRGYEYEDWLDAAAADTAACKHDVPRAAVAAAYADPPGNKYIDGWPDDEPVIPHDGHDRWPLISVPGRTWCRDCQEEYSE